MCLQTLLLEEESLESKLEKCFGPYVLGWYAHIVQYDAEIPEVQDSASSWNSIGLSNF